MYLAYMAVLTIRDNVTDKWQYWSLNMWYIYGRLICHRRENVRPVFSLYRILFIVYFLFVKNGEYVTFDSICFEFHTFTVKIKVFAFFLFKNIRSNIQICTYLRIKGRVYSWTFDWECSIPLSNTTIINGQSNGNPDYSIIRMIWMT